MAKKSIIDGEEADVGEMIITTDYISVGNLIGEMGILTSSRRNSSCSCESSVQVTATKLQLHSVATAFAVWN